MFIKHDKQCKAIQYCTLYQFTYNKSEKHAFVYNRHEVFVWHLTQ